MPIWAWVLLVVAGLAVLLLSFRVRYRLEWAGEWSWARLSGGQQGSASLEWGFPGLMFPLTSIPLKGLSEKALHALEPEEKPATPAAAPESAPVSPAEDPAFSPEAQSAAPNASAPKRAEARTAPQPSPGKKPRDPHRWRRALFHFATDAKAWLLLARAGLRFTGLFFGLLNPRIVIAVGHPDPVRLGRWAGRWYAVSPFFPLRRVSMNFRFQDRTPSLRVSAEGTISVLRVLVFIPRFLFAFPWIALSRRGWRGWKRHRLTGWRAWVYAELQKAS